MVLVATGCYGGSDGNASGAETDGSGDDDGGSAGDDDGVDGGSDDGDGDDGVPDDLDPLSVLEPLAARLNDIQYRNTVLDLFGETLTEQEVQWLPRDVPIEGSYSTSAEAQGFNAQYVLGYAYIARGITERLDLDAVQMQFGDCTGVDAACIDDFVAGLGLRMFRRPLDETERQTYADLADAIASDPDTSDDDVVRGVIQALMQAPAFLYRLERETEGTAGEVRRIDGYELASRLSYFLWQSTPDAALLQFAAGPDGDGDFDGSALPAEVDRMIADAKFARARTNFWGDYSLASTSSFGTTDPDLAEELRDSLFATLDRISGVDADAQPLSALFDGQEIVMSPAVADIAGAESLGPGLQVYDVALAEERIGVITHPSFLSAIGTTSFVGRGVFMTERLLCQHTPPPPEDVAEDIMMTAQATEDLTPREASEFRFGLEPVCVGCHTQFEPIAYGFERYGADGRYSLTDEQGRDLFSDGVLPAGADRPEIVFADAAELLSALGDLDPVHRCLVENMAEFGYGRPAHWAGEFLPNAVTGFQDDGLTFDALVGALAGSDQLFYMRIVE
ncbi:MAG: DUF1588 domain-containing protein [Myxococcota bacterium]